MQEFQKNLDYVAHKVKYMYLTKQTETRYMWFFGKKNLDLDSNLYDLKKR